MVAIFALIGEALLQASRQLPSGTTLGLGETLSRGAEFVWMRNFLAGRQRQEMQKAGINAYRSCANHRNSVRWCVNTQAQIPARRPLDETPTLEPSSRDVLLMEANRPYPWYMETCAVRGLERIRKGNTVEPVPPAFKLGLLGEFLVAALPGNPGGIEHPLQRMTRNAELFAVIGQQVVKGLLTVIDAVVGIGFDFLNGPVPDTRQMP